MSIAFCQEEARRTMMSETIFRSVFSVLFIEEGGE